MPSQVRWAVGLTTCPERADMLTRTLVSLDNAGIPDPRLFIDGVHRCPRVRAFGNWLLGLLELYIRDPRADLFLMLQDDLLAGRGLRAYLESSPLPPKGYGNLLTIYGNENVIADPPIPGRAGPLYKSPGWYESQKCKVGQEWGPLGYVQTGRGAVALLFPREAVEVLLDGGGIVSKIKDTALGWRNETAGWSDHGTGTDGGSTSTAPPWSSTSATRPRWRGRCRTPRPGRSGARNSTCSRCSRIRVG